MSTVSINCPHCQSTAIRRKGMTSSGNQRYLCKACHKSFTLTPVGRPCLGDRPLTNYQKVKRYRLQRSNPHPALRLDATLGVGSWELGVEFQSSSSPKTGCNGDRVKPADINKPNHDFRDPIIP